MTEKIPTERVDIIWTDWMLKNTEPHSDERALFAMQFINAKVAELRAARKRVWFEVWYPETTEENFDAIEVLDDGTMITLPPYEELLK